MNTQVCSRCGDTKDLDQFHIDKYRSNGRKSACKLCLRPLSKSRSAQLRANPVWWEAEKRKQRERRLDPNKKLTERHSQLKYRYSTHGRATCLFNSAKKRAAKSKIPFTITASDVERALNEADQKFTALPFDHTGRNRALTPSLDQINPGQGYTPDNIRIIHLCWNMFKGDFFNDTEAIVFAKTMANIL